jgi:hypothetical protein
VENLFFELEEPLNELRDLQAEYEEWYNNMPEGLQQGATGEKLMEMTNLDIPESVDASNIGEVLEFAESAEQLELPQGFGRD